MVSVGVDISRIRLVVNFSSNLSAWVLDVSKTYFVPETRVGIILRSIRDFPDVLGPETLPRFHFYIEKSGIPRFSMIKYRR